MKKVLLTGIVLCLTASVALAGGLAFNWSTSTDCPSANTANQNFACNSNTAAAMYMVPAVQANVALPGFNALDCRIDAQSVGAVPAWWQGFIPSSCRGATAITTSAPPDPLAAGTVCATAKLWNNLVAYGGIGAYTYDAVNRWHMVVGYAAAGNRATNLTLTGVYNAFSVKVMTTNTVYVAPDPDNEVDEVLACAGCADGVTFVLNQINLNGSGGSLDQVTLPLSTSQQCITWQGGAGPTVCSATPARNTTWGQVKSLYR
jgi:hypothetical protein